MTKRTYLTVGVSGLVLMLSAGNAAHSASVPIPAVLVTQVEGAMKERFLRCPDGVHFRSSIRGYQTEEMIPSVTVSYEVEPAPTAADRLNGVDQRISVEFKTTATRHRDLSKGQGWSQWENVSRIGNVTYELHGGTWRVLGASANWPADTLVKQGSFCCGPVPVITC